jgi:acetyltransferase-like isoleucine patch superfamily enzyme
VGRAECSAQRSTSNGGQQMNRRQIRRARSGLSALLTPSLWAYVFRLLTFLYEGHVKGRHACTLGVGVRLSPTSTFRNAHRISIGAETHIGEGCSLWAGDQSGRIDIGRDTLFGPGVYITASNYGLAAGLRIMSQTRVERSVSIGDDVWLGANVVVLPGVTIGDGCVVGSGAVVTRDILPGSIAVGVPARVVGRRK